MPYKNVSMDGCAVQRERRKVKICHVSYLTQGINIDKTEFQTLLENSRLKNIC